jgi:hypothetical protein
MGRGFLYTDRLHYYCKAGYDVQSVGYNKIDSLSLMVVAEKESRIERTPKDAPAEFSKLGDFLLMCSPRTHL